MSPWYNYKLTAKENLVAKQLNLHVDVQRVRKTQKGHKNTSHKKMPAGNDKQSIAIKYQQKFSL